MGKGNWRPYQDCELYELRYFNLMERYEVTEEEWDSYYSDLFIEEIKAALPGSFWEDDNKVDTQVIYSSFSQSNRRIFRNELVCIMIDANADAHHVGVAMVRLENYWNETWVENFNERYLKRSSGPFFDRMGGKQRVRTSAWTSEEV